MATPSNATYANGANTVSGDQLNTFLQTVTNVASLRAFVGKSGMAIMLQGLSTPDDGGEGFFLWSSLVTEPDDGRNYILPTGANSGGWVRLGPLLSLPVPTITGTLSAVTDPNAKAVLTSIISAMVALGQVTNGTT